MTFAQSLTERAEAALEIRKDIVYRYTLPSNHPQALELEPQTSDYEVAKDRLLEDAETVGIWIGGGEIGDWDERQPCKYFGPISSQELVKLGLSGKFNAEQAKAAWDELSARFFQAHNERIERDALKNAETRMGIY